MQGNTVHVEGNGSVHGAVPSGSLQRFGSGHGGSVSAVRFGSVTFLKSRAGGSNFALLLRCGLRHEVFRFDTVRVDPSAVLVAWVA